MNEFALFTVLIAVDLLAFAMFELDKIKAGRWRVRESTLLMLALLGVTPGTYAGRALFRHKTPLLPSPLRRQGPR